MLQLLRLLLPPKYGEAVLAVLVARPPLEHGPAVKIVVLQCLAALRVGKADPPKRGGGNGNVPWQIAEGHSHLASEQVTKLSSLLAFRTESRQALIRLFVKRQDSSSQRHCTYVVDDITMVQALFFRPNSLLCIPA